MDFQVWDFPGQIDVFDNPSFDMEAIFGEIGALIWVIDAQDDYLEAVARLNITILSLQRTYPNINIEVFIHKVDGLSDDYKLDIQREAWEWLQLHWFGLVESNGWDLVIDGSTAGGWELLA